MLVEGQLVSFGADRDRLDADAVMGVHRALSRIRGTHRGFVGRTARESVQKIWQEPRMPRLRYNRHKPLEYPWSPAARDAYFAGEARGRLVLEHATPISHMTDAIFDRVEDPAFGVEEMLAHLQDVHRGLSFTVITKQEDNRITASGYRDAVADGADVWSRYEAALGLDAESFGAVVDDPRYGGEG